ncbi:MAG: hypothetical protein WC956_01440 [bacterium]
MILMGCSPVGTLEPKQPNTPPSSMPVSSSADPEILRLWEEIKSGWLTNNLGKPLSILEKEIDTGFRGFERGQLSDLINTQGTIEPQEILEYAYAHDAYYGFLARHGFPVPFAMDDFDPTTTRDAELKETLAVEVRKLKSAYDATEKANKSRGTDVYTIGLAEHIREGLRHYSDAAKKDCPTEMADWQALDKSCGACTEFSAILFFAYKHAGLDPRFMSMARTDPSISSMYLFLGDLAAYGHQVIGIPLSGGRYFYSDLMTEANTSQGLYRYAIELSPRQFATVHLFNKTKDANPIELISITDKLKKLAPEVLSIWTSHVIAEIMTHSMLPEKFGADMADIQRRFGNTPAVEFETETLIEAYNNNGKQDIFKMLKAMEKLDQKDPEGGLMLRVVMGGLLLSGSPGLNKAHLYDMIRPAVDRDPLVYAGVGLLREISRFKFYSRCRDRVEMFSELSERFSDHNTIKLLLGEARMSCWKEEQKNSLKMPGPNLFISGISVMKELADRLEPEAFEPHYQLSENYYDANDLISTSTEFKKVLTLLEKESEAKIRNAKKYARILAIGCTIGDANDVQKICDKFQRFRTEEFPKLAVETLCNDASKIYSGQHGAKISVSELDKRSENIRTVIGSLSRANTERIEIDRLKLRHAVHLFVLSGGDAQLARRMSDGARLDNDKIAGYFADYVETDITPAVLAGNRESFKLVERSLNYFNELLQEGQKKPLVPANVAVALLAYSVGEEEKGNSHLRAAFRIDAAEAKRIYYDWIYKRMLRQTSLNSNVASVVKGDGLNKFEKEWNEPNMVPADLRLPVAKAWRQLAQAYGAINDVATRQDLLKKVAELSALSHKKRG